MTTSKPHPKATPHHAREDGDNQYQLLDHHGTLNGRRPEPAPDPYLGRRIYPAFQGKQFRIPIIAEFVVGNIGMVISGLLVPFGTGPAHVVCAIGFIGCVIILNAACCTLYAYKWKTKKTIVGAICVTALAAICSAVLVVAPIVSLIADKYIIGLILQVVLITVGLGELSFAAFIIRNSVQVLRRTDRRRERTVSCISGDEAPIIGN